MIGNIALRPVEGPDIPIFHGHLTDPVAALMAAFTPPDTSLEAHTAHWERILRDESVIARTITAAGEVIGHVACFGPTGERELTYWIDRAHWGKGFATAALSAFLAEAPERPMMARAAADNAASVRVLEKCGFAVVGHDRFHANARGEEIDEIVMTLA